MASGDQTVELGPQTQRTGEFRAVQGRPSPSDSKHNVTSFLWASPRENLSPTVIPGLGSSSFPLSPP